jgi:hypothetical protein
MNYLEKLLSRNIVINYPWRHISIVSSERGKLDLYVDGIKFTKRNFTIDLWIRNQQLENFLIGKVDKDALKNLLKTKKERK